MVIVNATETKMALDASPTPTPTDTPAPVVTATPVAVQAIEVQPTVVPPVSSGMQPIVAAPARLAGEALLQVGIQEGGVLLSSDGTRLAVLSVNGTARLLNAATLEQIELIVPAATTITHVSFSPDGTLLAVGQADGDVRLLDARTGAQLDVIEGDGWVSGLAFGGEGQLLAILRSGVTLNTLWLYSLETGQQTAVVVYDLPLAGAAFSADGSQIVVGMLDGRVLALAVGGE
jgi:WD40 repeat protein